jgi:sucrose phosphorylase
LHIDTRLEARIREHLAFLYGIGQAGAVWEELETILRGFRRHNPDLTQAPSTGLLTERDAILITYGDQFQELGLPPLQTLHQVLTQTLDRPVSGVHILPFYPYSSDDGFSVIDYTKVNPDLGTWADVERLGQDFRLMFDAVINHISRRSDWFQRFLAGDPDYTDWFITVEPDTDLSQVVRPRALPLLTPVEVRRTETASDEKLVWTTFSDDQIDLNFAHPAVLLRVIEVLLFYVEKGAQLIRLDAIAYLWKEIGTPCIHLEQTHRVIKLLRCVLDAVAPSVLLITETNVPHKENISYYGTCSPETGRTDEAQLVYQFPLAPLVMHSLLTGNAQVLSRWAADLETPCADATFFNFTASHDGIGVMPARGLLSEAEIQALVDTTMAHGGRVSYKANPDGSQSVYELNISYFDALSDPAAAEPIGVQVDRFVVSQAIMLALAGVPGIYTHSLIGSRSWQEGVVQTGRNRTINREKLDRARLERELADQASLRHQVFAAYRRLLHTRAAEPAFHPYGGQRVLELNDAVFAFLRTACDGSSPVLCAHNVSDQVQLVNVPAGLGSEAGNQFDLLSGEVYASGQDDDQDGWTLALPPYAVRWVRT